MRRSDFIATAAALAATPLAGAAPAPRRVANQIRDEFRHVWDGYKRCAWGFDELLPLSATGSNFFVPSHSFGLSMIEALDTLYVMELDDQVDACVRWLKSNLTFDVDGNVQMFEAVIRMVGGLLSGFYATGDRFLLDASRDLADRLLPCFSKSPSGAPYRFANLRTGAVSDPKSNLAEIGSNVLEFGDLSRLTGDPKYRNASMAAFAAVMKQRSSVGLLGTNFDVESGSFIGVDDVAPDEPVDSFYEYLWGGWQMLRIEQCRDWYRSCTDALLKYKTVHVDGRLWFQTVDYTTGAPMGDPQLTELSSFYAELVAKGGDRAVGEAFFDSWSALLQQYEIIPEVIDYRTLSIVDAGNATRPEYANAAFDLWFLTGNEKYRQWAYRYFTNLRTHARVPNGYADIGDVRPRPMTKKDHFPAYSFSENFKYLYLMFADSPRFDPASYYLNTEGKMLRGLRPARS